MSTFDDLDKVARWVAWRNEMRGGKPTKVPHSPHGGMAKADDPATWGNRAQAAEIARRIVNGQGGGIGIQLGDLGAGAELYLAGVDLDSCIDEHGTLAPWATAILERVNTYAEISPSGHGIKAFFYIDSAHVRAVLDRLGVPTDVWGCRRGIPGHNSKDHGPGVEFYCNLRYFTITGNRWPSAPDTIELLDSATLDRLVELIPPAPQGTGGGGKQSGDTSRSASALKKARALRRAGKTFEEMVEALREDAETSAWVREKGETAGQRELHRIWDKAEAKPALSEDALALRFTEAHPELRHVAIWSRWLIWDGILWAADNTLRLFDWARLLCREEPRADGKAKTVAAIVSLARADRRHAMTNDEWDADDDFMTTKGE